MGVFDFGSIPFIQQELRRFFASRAQGELADTSLQPADVGEVVQAQSARLSSVAGLSATSGGVEKTGINTFGAYTLTAFGKSLVASADAAAGRSTLALTIGSNVQAWNTNLDAIAGLSSTGAIERTGAGTASTFTVTAYGKTVVAAANAGAARTVLGVAIGSQVQAWNAELDGLAALSTAGLVKRTGAGAFTAAALATADIADAAITTAKLASAVADRLMPTGSIMPWPSTTVPTGWVKANGALLSRTTYASLWAFANASGNIAANDGAWVAGQFSPGDGSTTFRIPDLRGEFVRGWDDGRGIDSGRAIGTLQGASRVGGHLGRSSGQLASTVVDSDGSETYSQNLGEIATTQGGTVNHNRFFIRPRNVAQLYIIKF